MFLVNIMVTGGIARSRGSGVTWGCPKGVRKGGGNFFKKNISLVDQVILQKNYNNKLG